MYLMQYRIFLPADYDMQIIRKRVTDNGHRTDAFDGLAMKLYMIREVGLHGSPNNEYSPLYLWNSTQSAGRFLWGGGGFYGLSASFGRPAVQQWLQAGLDFGSDVQLPPRWVSVEQVDIPSARPLEDSLRALQAGNFETSRSPGVFACVLGINPSSWQAVTFTLWNCEAAPAIDGVAEVLHVSAPALHPHAAL